MSTVLWNIDFLEKEKAKNSETSFEITHQHGIMSQKKYNFSTDIVYIHLLSARS